MDDRNNKNADTKRLVKAMLLMRGMTVSELARKLNEHFGYSFTQSNLSRKLSTDTVRWSELKDIASILGYSIRISPVSNFEEYSKKPKSQVHLTTVL